MPVDIKKPLKKFLPHLLQAKAESLNEADTVQRLILFFQEVLGYDLLKDISREAEMKGKYVDVVLKVDGAIRLLVEAKAGGVRLYERHIEQAQSYASRNNYPWVVLTNGTEWRLYHLTFDSGIEYTEVYTIDLDDENEFDDSSQCLALLHYQSIKKGELEEFWNQHSALAPDSLGKAIFNESVLAVIRRELRKDTKILMDIEDIAHSIQSMLTPEARESIGKVKIRKRKQSTKKAEQPSELVAPPSEVKGSSSD